MSEEVEEVKRVLTAKERVEAELQELNDKHIKLRLFMVTEAFNKLPQEQRALLEIQADTMRNYERILQRRLEIWE